MFNNTLDLAGMPWVKGQSGNPSGRARGAAGLAKYIRSKTNDLRDMIDLALEIASGAGPTPSSTRDRVAAINIVLDRALGKPDQSLSVATDTAPAAQIDLSRFTTEQLEQYADLLEIATGRAIEVLPAPPAASEPKSK